MSDQEYDEEMDVDLPNSVGVIELDDDEDEDDEELDSLSANESDSAEEVDDDEIEDQLYTKYSQLLQTVTAQKFDYDSYVALVQTAHQLSDLDKIRESSELFSASFPLTSGIWLQWINVEVNIATTEEELQRVNGLFRRALTDYFSMPVALEYAKFASKLPNAESVMNEIVDTYTHDCLDGSSIFKEWRKFYAEKAADAPEKSKKLLEKFLYELSLPLSGIEETYTEFCEKYSDDTTEIDWQDVNEKYHKSRDNLYAILQIENELLMQDEKDHRGKAAVFAKYIEKGKSFLNNKMIQALYERMVATCCLDASCWMKYIKYLQSRKVPAVANDNEKSLVFSQSVLDVLNRALRNCSWNHDLHVTKLHEAERQSLPKAELTEIVQQALEATNTNAQGHLNVWLQYLSYTKRITDVSVEKDVQLLRKVMELGLDTLARRSADPSSEFNLLCARIEYETLKDASRGFEYINDAMMNPDNTYKASLWIEFAHLEGTKGLDAARKVYRRAIKVSNINDFDSVMSSWKVFELTNGSIDQIRDCNEFCQKVIQDYNQKLSQSRKEKTQPAGKGQKRKPDSVDAEQQKVVPQKKQKVASTNQKKQEVVKKKSDSKSKDDHAERNSSEKDAVTVFLSNLSFDVSKNEVIDAFPELNIQNVDLVVADTGRGRGFGYLELTSAEEVTKALSFDRRLIGERPVYISRISRDKEARGGFKYSTNKESRKLFIKGLPFDATKDELEELFGKFGKIKDARLVTRKDGSSKGIAFVEFEEESAASKSVLAMDSHVLRNFTISVSISDPPPKNAQKSVADHKPKTFPSLHQPQRPPRSEAKPRLTFIPTSVQRSVTKEKPSTEPNGASTSAPKSNDYFRQLLMKK